MAENISEYLTPVMWFRVANAKVNISTIKEGTIYC